MSNSSLQPARVIVQMSIPCGSLSAGNDIYERIKRLVKSFDESSTINGQIMQQLEQCSTCQKAATK